MGLEESNVVVDVDVFTRVGITQDTWPVWPTAKDIVFSWF